MFINRIFFPTIEVFGIREMLENLDIFKTIGFYEWSWKPQDYWRTTFS
jgi:hypothetical protein